MVWRDVTLVLVEEEIKPMRTDQKRRWLYVASELGLALIIASVVVGGLLTIGGLLG